MVSRRPFWIAVELRRLGVKDEAALVTLEDWNPRNLPPMQATVLRGKVRSAFKKEYKFGCFSRSNSFGFALGDSLFCIGPDACPYHKQHPSGAREYGGPWAIIDAGWGHKLNKGTTLCYIGLQCAERYRAMKPGSRLYIQSLCCGNGKIR